MVVNKMNNEQYNIACKSCGEDDNWDGFEEMMQVNAKEGHVPQLILIGGCGCGHQQKINDVE
tara:strand:+ start:778 stop:963 length:186 start_codon:yes stop_codon:yes gene_type:complete